MLFFVYSKTVKIYDKFCKSVTHHGFYIIFLLNILSLYKIFMCFLDCIYPDLIRTIYVHSDVCQQMMDQLNRKNEMGGNDWGGGGESKACFNSSSLLVYDFMS